MKRTIARALACAAGVSALLGVAATIGARVGRAQSVHSGASYPFIYRADFSLDQYAGLFAELEQIRTELARVLALPPPREAVRIVLFQNEAAYREFGKKHLPSVVYRRALFVKSSGLGTVYAYQSPELPVDLRHEATHGLLHATLGFVPLWLDEGLAEYFEVAPAQRAAGNPHYQALKWNLRLGIVPRLARLETRRDISEMTAGDYRDAWAWVHFMLHGPVEARQELVRFLSDIHAEIPPGQLSQRLEARLGPIEKRLAEHFRTWTPPAPAPQVRQQTPFVSKR